MSSQPSRSASPVPSSPAFASLALLIGGVALYWVIWEMLDRPPTWQCTEPASNELAELSSRRRDFLLAAAPLAIAYTVLVAACAWIWAAGRRARQGYERRPGRLARTAAFVLGPLWALLVAWAFLDYEVGGAIIYGFMLGAATAALAAVIAAGVICIGLFHSGTRSRVEETVDALSVGLPWSLLLVVLPYILIAIGASGKDGTIWC